MMNIFPQTTPTLFTGEKQWWLSEEPAENLRRKSSSVEKSVITTCTIDCGGRCPLLVTVKDGAITKISSFNDGEVPPLNACIRGIYHHYKVYAPDRLKYPLIRVGERGEGRFRRISWDKALDIVAREMKRIKETYGPEAIFECAYNGGNGCILHLTDWGGALYRLLNLFGGCTRFGTFTSEEGAKWASTFTYGISDGRDSNSWADLVNSKLIILWGRNVAEARHGSGSLYWFKLARDMGIKIIYIDPCCTDTVNLLKAEWIPIRPSTDTAMLIAMAYVLITKKMYDEKFVNRYVFGFDQYCDYVLGTTDGTPKTPQWAEEITGVSAKTIVRLSEEYARNKPAALIQGWSPGRTASGEQYHRAAIALQAMSGNIGISGGSGSCDGLELIGVANPIVKKWKANSLLRFGGIGVEIKNGTWAEAVLRGKEGGYPSNIKMIYVVGHDILTQRQNTKKGIDAFKKVEFVVCHEQFLTPTARYADIILPANTNFERNDIAFPWVKGDYAIFVHKAIDSLWDSKSDLEIVNVLAKKLGFSDFETKSEEELLKEFFEESILKEHVTYRELKRRGLIRWKSSKPRIAFEKQIADPNSYPFPTPSGKIEIFSQRLKQMDFNSGHYSGVTPDYRYIPFIPKFMSCEELPNAPRAKKYSLQLITPHSRYRAHSQFYNIPKLKQLYEHTAWIHPNDAKNRGIRQGDNIRIYNDQGAIIVKAEVTERIMPGVVRCYEGTWHDPDEQGIDRGGCVNVLVNDLLTSYAGVSNFNTCLVEIAKEDSVQQ